MASEKFNELISAINKGNKGKVGLLLEKEVHIEDIDKNGRTALYYAVKSKNKEMVELLELCLAKGYKAVMQHRCSVPDTISISDEVGVQHVDLGQYDRLCQKEVAAS